ncbi:MAG: MFS transporter [Candidatus Heimdallarchaeota archaeon]|nr:MFS transporter [Candidatus Heimdallarchaeota archaeon]MCK4877077.1 MFS transporter [Candidatus Heimdallarchaeota archaeon]
MQLSEKKTTATLREISLLLTGTLVILAPLVVSPALPQMALFFSGISNAETLVKLVVTLPALSIAIGAPVVGIIIDKWGRRWMLISATVVYGLSGVTSFFLKNIYAILALRVLLGLAVSGIMTCTVTLIADYYTGEKRNRVMGFQTAVSYFTAVVILIGGGAIAEINWNYPFLIYLIAFVFLPGVIFFLNEPEINKETKSEEFSENIHKIPYRTLIIGYFLAFIFLIFFYLLPTQIPFYLTESIINMSETRIGIALAATSLFAGIISFNYKYLRLWIKQEVLFILALIFMGSGYITLTFDGSYGIFLLGLILSGLGIGIMLPNLNIWTVKDTPERFRGRALSILNAIIYLGAFLSPIINDSILQRTNYSTIFMIGSIVFFSLIIIPFSLFILDFSKQRKVKEKMK